MDRFAPYAKAITAALVGGLTALGVALTDGAVTPAEWVAVALGVLAPGGVTYAVPNRLVARHISGPTEQPNPYHGGI